MKSKKIFAVLSVFLIMTLLAIPYFIPVTVADMGNMPKFPDDYKHVHMYPPDLMTEPDEGTHWHALYPESQLCHQYDLINWVDADDSGSNNVGDLVMLQNEETLKWEWYRVEWITVTIKVQYKLEIKYLEFNGTWTQFESSFKYIPPPPPGYTEWHEVYPNYCTYWQLMLCVDKDMDGVISAGDWAYFTGPAGDFVGNVDELSTDMILSPIAPRPAITNTGTHFLIQPNNTNIVLATGLTFDVAVYIENAPATYSWEVKLGFNLGVLNVLSYTEGTWLTNAAGIGNTSATFTPAFVANGQGFAVLAAQILGQNPAASGDGWLCNVTFQVMSAGTSKLDLYNGFLGDLNNVETFYPSSDSFFVEKSQQVHDVAIWDLTVNTTETVPGDRNVGISVTVHNEGNFTQDAVVKVYADWVDVYDEDPDVVLIDEVVIDHTTAPGMINCTPIAPLTFTWDTTGLRGETWFISAEIIKIDGNTDDDPHDNLFIGQQVKVKYLHDLKVSNIKVLTPAVNAGDLANITVTIANQGTSAENNFNVTVKADNIVIETRNIAALASQTSTTELFNWDTTGRRGTYTISAELDNADDEPIDNQLTDGTVEVKVHDIRITSLHVGTKTCRGYNPSGMPALKGVNGSNLIIQIGIKNEGTEDEGPIIKLFLNMTQSYFISATGQEPITDVDYNVSPITLPAGEEMILNVEWPTAGLYNPSAGIFLIPPVEAGNYSVSAVVLPALGETDLADNTFYYDTIGLWTFVVSVFDPNADLSVDIGDVGIALRSYSAIWPFVPP